jgi:hypothetical protein
MSATVSSGQAGGDEGVFDGRVDDHLQTFPSRTVTISP